mgnify:CR=1 FL=1
MKLSFDLCKSFFNIYLLAQKNTGPPASVVEGATAAPTDEELKVQRLLQESSATAAGNTESTDADREGCDTTDVFQVITP